METAKYQTDRQYILITPQVCSTLCENRLVLNNLTFTRIWLALPLAPVSKRTRCPIPSEGLEGKCGLTVLPRAIAKFDRSIFPRQARLDFPTAT